MSADVYPSIETGKLVADVAIGEWHRGVREPPGAGSERIDTYIRGSLGLGWGSVEVGTDARPDIPYQHNGDFEWCGAFAAFCWSAAGLHSWYRSRCLPSTARLLRWSSPIDGPATRDNYWGNARRRIALKDIRPGDIVVVGPAGSTAGKHITLATSFFCDGEVDTVEGNHPGRGPTGDRYEGVTTDRRRTKATSAAAPRILYAVRPLAADLEP